MVIEQEVVGKYGGDVGKCLTSFLIENEQQGSRRKGKLNKSGGTGGREVRKFKCRKCRVTNTLYEWNTFKKAFGGLTLHEVKDYWDEFGEDAVATRKRLLFTCPSCGKGSKVDEIDEVEYKDFSDEVEDKLNFL